MTEALRTRYFELKQKRERLVSSRALLAQTVKDLRSNALTVGHYRSQLEEIEQKKGKSNPTSILEAHQKLASAERISKELFDRRRQLALEIDELSTSEQAYNQHLRFIASKLNSAEIEDLLPNLEQTENKRNAALSALQIGKSIDRILEDVTEQLWEAKEFGFFDLIGVPLLGDYMKYKKFRAAKKQILELQDLLKEYILLLQSNSFELRIPDQPNISKTTEFFDYLFDGVVLDTTVLSKIITSLNDYNTLQKKIQGIQDQLEDLIVHLNSELEQMQLRIIQIGQLFGD